jgi:hypothetical protein
MEPVLPKIVRRRAARAARSKAPNWRELAKFTRTLRRVETIENAAVPRNGLAAVLAADAAFHPGLEKIAAMTGCREHKTDQAGAQRIAAERRHIASRNDRRHSQSADQAAPGLARRQRRDEFRSAEDASCGKRARIRRPDDQEYAENNPFRVRRIRAQCDECAGRYADIKRTQTAPHGMRSAQATECGSDERASDEKRRGPNHACRHRHARNRAGNRNAGCDPLAAVTISAHHAMPFARRGQCRERHEAREKISADNRHADGDCR